MARLALTVGYTSRASARAEQPVSLYLGTSFQAAKEAAANPPVGIGYTEAYRLDSTPGKRFHLPVPATTPVDPEPAAAAAAEPEPGPELPAVPGAESAADLDLLPEGKRGSRKA